MSEGNEENKVNGVYECSGMVSKAEKQMSIFKMGGILVDLYAGIILFSEVLNMIFCKMHFYILSSFLESDYKVKLLAACAAFWYSIICLILKKDCPKCILFSGIIIGLVLGIMGLYEFYVW